jgi:glycerate dehydrogenase
MMKAVVLDGYALNPGDLSWDVLKNAGSGIELAVYDRTPPAEAAARIGSAEAAFTNKTIVSRETIAACPNLKYIGVLATGYHLVEGKAAAARGIPGGNAPGYSTDSVAQLVFALLLEICHHPGAHSDAVHAGRWVSSKDYAFWDFPLIELAGKTLGIIGLGSIGTKVARLAAAFGMKVIANSRTEKPEGKKVARYVELDELFAKSDIISLHCPELPETRGIINKEAIAAMKDGVVIINTSRGGLVAEADLAAALNSGKVYAAGVDVLSAEPPKADNPLLSAKNCIITPHIAWAPTEARKRLMAITEANFRAFLAGAPQNVVN